MQKKIAPTLGPEEVPEVIEFLDAQEALQAFKEEHAAVFAEFGALAERYNAALENADKACRGREISCGPMQLYQFSTKYDAEALYNAVGRDKFLEMGGRISTKTAYDVDKGRLEVVIAQNKLPKDTVDQVRKETPNFHKPEKLILP